MSPHKYILQPYKGAVTRHRCPACGKPRQFTLYVNIDTGEPIADDVGKCNRLDKCGYHYTPKQYFSDMGYQIPTTYKNIKSKTLPKPTDYITPEILQSSLKSYGSNHFVTYLHSLFGTEITNKLISDYPIGTSKHWPGATVFWQVDARGNVRTGKIMLYDAGTGKRVKQPYNHITWAHTLLKTADFNLKQCLFGEHLITQHPYKPIAIVESEKTAIIASVYMPAFNCLATGGAKNLNKEMFSPLQGKKIVLFPDVNQHHKWKQTVADILLPNTHVSVSDYLEKNATPQMREQGADLADILVKPDTVAGWALTDYDYPIMWD